MRTLLLLLALSISATAQVTERYDKFKDTTVQTFNDGYVHGEKGRSIKFYAHYIVEKKEYWLRFVHTGRIRLSYDDSRNLTFLIDGERIQFGRGKYDVDNDKYGLIETMIFNVTKEDLEQIANGRVVQFQLGTFEATLSEKQKKGVKELLGYTVK